jgi:hypothetical protein
MSHLYTYEDVREAAVRVGLPGDVLGVIMETACAASSEVIDQLLLSGEAIAIGTIMIRLDAALSQDDGPETAAAVLADMVQDADLRAEVLQLVRNATVYMMATPETREALDVWDRLSGLSGGRA